MKKLIIFDLDGTLLDSLVDIAESMDEVLTKNQFPTHTIEAYKYKIGRGIENLVIASLPESIDKEDYPKYIKQMREVYGKRWMLKTKPYNGILEVLQKLKAQKIKLAILSNKPQIYTDLVVKELLGDIKFDSILGSRENVPIKPAPDAVFEILKALKINGLDTIFVGDTSIDMQTATNAEIESIGVAWGFRPVSELIAADATHIIYTPNELIDLILDEDF